MNSIATHQRRLKWLTMAAVAFWALAVLGTAGVLIGYSLFISPKEEQMFADYGTHGRIWPDRRSPAEAPTSTDRAVWINATMTYVVTKGILIVALSVVVLSCGTLATLLLVIFNRRVTLRQINHSLAQISAQLKELQNARAAL